MRDFGEEEVEEPRVLAIACGDRDTPTYAVMLNNFGDVIDHLQLHWLLLRPNAHRETDRKRRADDWAHFK